MSRKAEIERNQADVRRAASDLRRKREEFERKTPRYTGTDDLIAEFRKAGKVKIAPLIRELAIAEAASEFLKLGSEVKIRRELIGIIATMLAGRPKWARAQASERKGKTTATHQKRWQAQADDIWARNPSLTKQAVAKQIAKGTELNANWIRRVISKRK